MGTTLPDCYEETQTVNRKPSGSDAAPPTSCVPLGSPPPHRCLRQRVILFVFRFYQRDTERTNGQIPPSLQTLHTSVGASRHTEPPQQGPGLIVLVPSEIKWPNL